MLRGITGRFQPLSPSWRYVVYVLRTRSPVPPKGPLDLHVLGLPLAFILSQDQTLHRMLVELIPNESIVVFKTASNLKPSPIGSLFP
jgi:hypothetical protein